MKANLALVTGVLLAVSSALSASEQVIITVSVVDHQGGKAITQSILPIRVIVATPQQQMNGEAEKLKAFLAVGDAVTYTSACTTSSDRKPEATKSTTKIGRTMLVSASDGGDVIAIDYQFEESALIKMGELDGGKGCVLESPDIQSRHSAGRFAVKKTDLKMGSKPVRLHEFNGQEMLVSVKWPDAAVTSAE